MFELNERKIIRSDLICRLTTSLCFLIFRSKWYTSEHFRGTYSFQSLTSERMDVRPKDLAEPVMNGNKPVCNPKIKITFLIIVQIII
jgi:hypothetical protein